MDEQQITKFPKAPSTRFNALEILPISCFAPLPEFSSTTSSPNDSIDFFSLQSNRPVLTVVPNIISSFTLVLIWPHLRTQTQTLQRNGCDNKSCEDALLGATSFFKSLEGTPDLVTSARTGRRQTGIEEKEINDMKHMLTP